MSLATTIAPSQDRAASANATAPCLYCGGTDYQPLYAGIEDRLGHVPGKWSFVKCQSCGSAMLSPTPKAEDLPAFYPPVYTFAPELAKPGTLKRWLANLEYNIFFRQVYRWQVGVVERFIRKHNFQPGRLLDIGCGRGLRLKEFRRLGFDVEGTDFVRESTEYVLHTLGIPTKCTDIEGLEEAYPAQSFDVVTGFYVVEHVTDAVQFIEQCVRLLKPNGVLVLALPLIDGLQARLLGPYWSQVAEAPRHISLPSRRGLRRLLETALPEGDIQFVSESAMQCAAIAALSLCPASNATKTYASHRLATFVLRVIGALLSLALIPWMVIENFLFGQPGAALVMATNAKTRLSPTQR